MTARVSRLLLMAALLISGCGSGVAVTAAPTPPATAAPTVAPTLAPTAAPTAAGHVLTGTVSLLGIGIWSYVKPVNKNDPLVCYGVGGYADIKAGAPVVVKDQAGTVIAAGQLIDGDALRLVYPSGSTFPQLSSRDCLIPFNLTLPDAAFYSVEISHRAALTYSRADLAAKGWALDLTLG